jgi:hypothetical protein
MTVGFGFYQQGAFAIGVAGFYDQTTGDYIDLYLNSLAQFTFRRNGTNIGSPSARAIGNAAWNYIEIKVVNDNSAGVTILKVNGEEWLNQTGLDTQTTATTFNHLRLNTTQTAGNTYYDDLYVCDGSGSLNTGFLGDVRVQAIRPTGAGGTTQWTASAGSNYQCVDDSDALADTDYVSETTTGEKDTYAFGNVTPTSGTVKGVQAIFGARKDDAGTRTIATVYGNGTPASDVDGTAVSVGDSYGFYSEIKEQDPVAVADWTISSVNGAEFGVKLTA